MLGAHLERALPALHQRKLRVRVRVRALLGMNRIGLMLRMNRIRFVVARVSGQGNQGVR